MKRILLLMLCFLSFSALVNAQDCSISSYSATDFQLFLEIRDDGSLRGIIKSTIPFPLTCLEKDEFKALLESDASCDKSAVLSFNDLIYERFGSLIRETSCKVSYEKERQNIVLSLNFITEKIVAKSGDVYSIDFEKWDIQNIYPDTKNTLAIALPKNSQLISYFPQKNSFFEQNAIIWNVFPTEAVSIKYSLSSPSLFESPLFILAVIFLIIASVTAYYHVTRKSRELKELEEEEKRLNKVMKGLNYSYLKRRISEDTYKRELFEYNSKLNEIMVKKKGLSKTNKKNDKVNGEKAENESDAAKEEKA